MSLLFVLVLRGLPGGGELVDPGLHLAWELVAIEQATRQTKPPTKNSSVKHKHYTRAGEPEPGVFGSLEPEQIEKKQEPEPLEKKVKSRSRSR